MQLIPIFFMILCAAYTANRRILCVLAQFFIVLKHHGNLSRKIVQLDLVGGTTILLLIQFMDKLRFSPEFFVHL